MGKTSGTILVLAGVALAAHTLSSHRYTAADVASPRAGPEIEAATRHNPVDHAKVKAKPERAPPAAPAPPSQRPATLAPPPTKIPAASIAEDSIAPPAVRLAEAPTRVPAGQYEPAGSPQLDRAALTREIQRQLKRVGCYAGTVTGVWSSRVRRAMKAFTDRVNATLPVDEPDQVLLAMVQSHRDAACGTSCPPGEGRVADGRCVPDALIAARADKQPAPPPPRQKVPRDGAPSRAAPAAVAGAPAPPASHPSGRMSLAGPRAEERPRSVERHVRAKAAQPRRRRSTRRARSARPPRYAESRGQRRYQDYRAHSIPPGFPAWAIPAFSP